MIEQVIINCIVSGCAYILVAISFTCIFSISHFFHFAHGIILAAGAYFTLLLLDRFGMEIWLSVVLSIGGSVIMGCLMEVSIYRPLRNRNSSSLILLLASLGIYILLQNVISMVFGDETQSIRTGVVREGLNVFGARITPIQIVTICVSVALVIALSVFLKTTKIGRAMRAVASDPQLANVSGIDSNRVILWAFAIGSGAWRGLRGY